LDFNILSPMSFWILVNGILMFVTRRLCPGARVTIFWGDTDLEPVTSRMLSAPAFSIATLVFSKNFYAMLPPLLSSTRRRGGKWLDLFNQQPQKALSFKSPYDAIEQIINPGEIITISKLFGKYFAYAKKTTKSVRNNKEHPCKNDIRQ